MIPPVDVVLLRVDREAGHHTAHPRHLHPALDLQYVEAGLLLRGVSVALIDGWLAPFSCTQIVARVLELRPRVVVIKAVTWCLEESLMVARQLRAAGVVTLATGQQVAHVQVAPHPAWPEAFDLEVAGEPEAVVPGLVTQLLRGDPVSGRQGVHQVEAPDELPVPSHNRDALEQYPFPFPVRSGPVQRWAYLLTSWGCPRTCRHCTDIVRRSVGRQLRERTVAKVVDEMLALRDLGAQFLCLDDDSLPVHRRRFLELCNEMVKRGVGLPWMANARPDELDEARVSAAADAGAVLFKVGVDSGSPRVIERLGKAGDGMQWVAATRAAFQRLNRAGIGSVALFMVGMPDETLEEAHQSLTLAKHIRPDYLQVQIYCAYPDVPLWVELEPSVRAVAETYHYAAPMQTSSRIPLAELESLQRRFYRQFYLRPGYVLRHARFFWRHYLPSGRGVVAPGVGQALGYLLRSRRNARVAT